MSEVYAETHGISGTPTEVFDEEAVVARIKDTDETGVFDEVAAYYAWEADCREQEQVVRDSYAQKPGHRKREVPIWERDGIKEIDRFRAKIAHDYLKFKQEGKEFSPAALAVTFSPESAAFFDDVKCDYLGHSEHDEWFREISPAHNRSPFDVQFNYNIGKLKAYTPSGNIIHIRETDDEMAKTRDQRQLVLAMNVLTREVNRYYPEDKTIVTPTRGVAYRHDTMVTLRPRILSPVSREVEVGPENQFMTVYQKAIEDASRQSLAKILYSGKDTMHFKREGFAETFESLYPIAELDRERYLLSGLAHAAGVTIGERGVVYDPRLHSYSAIAA